MCSAKLFDWIRSQPNVRSWARLPNEVTREGKAAGVKSRAVHAKVYRFFQANPRREYLFIGSANLTGPAHRRGGNLETGFLVEREAARRPDWWLEVDRKKVTIYEPRSEDEGAVSAAGSRLSLRYWWDSKRAEAFWDHGETSPALTVSWNRELLFPIDSLPSGRWIPLEVASASAMEKALQTTSILTVEGDRPEPAAVLVQEEGMAQRPSLLFDLSPAEILRYWSLLSTEQRAAFLEAHAPEMALTGEGAELVTKHAELVNRDSFFDRFAGIFLSFGQLERNVRESLKAGNDRAAVYRLFGQKYDSLGTLLSRVRKDREKGRDQLVEHYVMALCAVQMVKELRRDKPDFFREHVDETRQLDVQLQIAETLRNDLATGSDPSMPDFLDWFEKWFLGEGKAHCRGGGGVIDLAAARQLLNFGASIEDGPRADEQLAGAVAIHNILERQTVAYLADEVGMGKTYVALGAMALFRHFDPEFRVLVIAPRENIQRKWIKELGNFCANNLRFADLRVKSVRGGPARPMVRCDNLHSFVHEVAVDARRDFFLRLTSFSFGLSADSEAWKKQRNQLRRELPWLADEVFDLRSKEAFKDNYAKAVCCALPVFDLVIVDEGHNLKHGFREGVAARNRVLALAIGRESNAAPSLFPGYGRRAKRVLFLSATPIEESYHQLWNQLDVFGVGGPFADLKRRDVSDQAKKEIVKRFLVRRVTTMQVNGTELTKNQYRREWRQGGVLKHDEPIHVTDPRKRLVVALVQKKVAELLGSGKFNMSFQIGMLASFESFLQTAKVRREDDESNFDDAEQNRDLQDAEREGIDVRDINKLSRLYYQRFGDQMPHPKMDEVVDSLASAWLTGKKTLVFVRRVASVKELKKKLDERYDKWLVPFLRDNLPEVVGDRFDAVVERYREEKRVAEQVRQARLALPVGSTQTTDDDDPGDDRGGTDTFFAWFFRGDGPAGVVSGARIQKRFRQAGSAYSTFFDRNYVAEVLGVEPGQVARSLAETLGIDQAALRSQLREHAAKFLSARARRHPSHDRFVAAQAAALELLIERDTNSREAARIVFQQVYQSEIKLPPAAEAPELLEWLAEKTFFTELQRPDWAALREGLWPEPSVTDPAARFRESELRAQLLSATARLGQGLVDIYLLTIGRLKSLDLRTLDLDDGDGTNTDVRRITQYLSRLESQRTTPLSQRGWAAIDELREVAANFLLILDVNAPDVRSVALGDATRRFGTLLGQQQPIGGMYGQVNRRLVQQFRMPGYPLVLVTTDLLQEGEDLHTFCSSIHHYGISWTPSSMEQRIGRIDRVRSQTDRRLSALPRDPDGDDLLQVHFPHLQDTVEILQVERVLERMNAFLRLMHEGLVTAGTEDKHIDVQKALVRGRRPVEVIREKLRTAFPIPDGATTGGRTKLAVTSSVADSAAHRLAVLRQAVGERPGRWNGRRVRYGGNSWAR